MKKKISATLNEEFVLDLKQLGNGNLSKGLDKRLRLYKVYDECFAELDDLLEEDLTHEVLMEIALTVKAYNKIYSSEFSL